MFELKPVARHVLLAVCGGLGVSALSPAVAQTTPQQQQQLERVEVTGSLIRRIDGETSLPVTIISLDELKKAGVTNAEQAVKLITQAQGGTVTSRSVSGTNGAAAFVDLRSLGANRTLVLLNGKRVVANPFAVVAVDLNTLPIAALDRIETLSDGASATYGTDAIAGVINFVTRKDYKGVAVAGEVQIPQEGGGEIYTANLLAGFGDLAKQGFNVYGGINYRQQDPMRGTERDFSKTSYIPSRGFNALSPTTFPANYSQSSTSVNTNPSFPGCQPISSISTVGAPTGVGLAAGTCGADTQTFTNTIPEQEQISFFTKGTLALGPNHTLSGEYFFARNTVTTQIAPSPEGGLTLFPTSPFYPGRGITPANPALNTALPVSVSWRTTLLGSRSGEQVNDTQRVLASLDGTVGGFDYQLSGLWSNAKVENTFLNGYPKTQPLRNGVSGCLLTGTTCGAPLVVNGQQIFLNPFGPQTPEAEAYLRSNTVLGKVQDGESTIQGVSGVLSRSFGNLPGGPMTAALLAEFRNEEMVYNTDIALVSQAASSGLAGSGATRTGDRDISALGLEMAFPVLKNLEIGFGLRYDDYSDFGSTTNPKVSFKWQPNAMTLVRGSYNTGFAAPSLYNLYLPNSTTFTSTRYNDPVLCPGGVLAAGGVATRDCGIQFQQLQGGNANLTPEESKSWTVGFVLQPTPTFSFGMDYWNYKITDSISVIGEQSIFADPAKYASLYVRCSQADAARRNAIGACQIPGGDPLAYVINTFLNLGDVKTSGVDLQANWNSGATPYGQFNIGARGTYVIKYEFQVEPNGRWFDPVGGWSPQFAGPVIRYQQITNFGWTRNAYGANLIWRFQTGYKDQNGVPAPYNDNTVGDYSIFDLGLSYSGIKGLTLNAGILNLFDTDPPFTNQTTFFQARAYDDRFHNPLGRTFTLGARYEF